MFNVISFERLLEVTDRDLDIINDDLAAVHCDATLTDDDKRILICNAYNTINQWSSYFRRFKEIQDSKVNELVNENQLLKERIKQLETVIEVKNNSSNMIQVDIVDMVEKLESIAVNYEEAIKAAEHKAAMKTFNKRVASGDVKPAKRADVSDEYIIELYNNGASAYKIAQSVGMTQQAILYRIKKLKEAGMITE